MSNTNRPNYVRSTETAGATLTFEARRLSETASGVRRAGNADRADRLQAMAKNIQEARRVLGVAVIEESQRMVDFLEGSPLARSQDLEAPRPGYPTVFVDKPSAEDLNNIGIKL